MVTLIFVDVREGSSKKASVESMVFFFGSGIGLAIF